MRGENEGGNRREELSRVESKRKSKRVRRNAIRGRFTPQLDKMEHGLGLGGKGSLQGTRAETVRILLVGTCPPARW